MLLCSNRKSTVMHFVQQSVCVCVGGGGREGGPVSVSVCDHLHDLVICLGCGRPRLQIFAKSYQQLNE